MHAPYHGARQVDRAGVIIQAFMPTNAVMNYQALLAAGSYLTMELRARGCLVTDGSWFWAKVQIHGSLFGQIPEVHCRPLVEIATNWQHIPNLLNPEELLIIELSSSSSSIRSSARKWYQLAT